MSFEQSLSSFDFISELYKEDIKQATLLPEYPSSISLDAQFRNVENYIIHDPFPPPPEKLLKYLGPHHLMCGWGADMPITSTVKPHRALFEHWQKHFGEAGVPFWKPLSDADDFITIFPHESIPATQQYIHPKKLYHLHSKKALEEIECPQASVLNEIVYPCILKLSHGYAGLGNFFIRNAEDEKQAISYIDQHWPHAEYVLNEIIDDIVGDYGVQFYLNKHGKITWLGFTKQIFNEDYKWSGGTFSYQEQDKLYPHFEKIAQPVAHYLQKHGYYGVVGIDILQNKKNEFFLVDLNPRLTGITPFLIASRLFLKENYIEGIYIPSIDFSGSLESVLYMAEGINDAKVLVLSAYENQQTNKTTCHISISASSLEHCQNIRKVLRK